MKTNLSNYEPDPIKTDERPIWELVIEDMRQRDNAGRAKYGTPLQASNGRDALVDLYQELMDATCYIRQEIERRSQKECTGSSCTGGHRCPACNCELVDE